MILDSDFPTDHGAEGSAACLAVLQLLTRWRGGLPISEIGVITGLQRDQLYQALNGLRARERVVKIGSGTAATYSLKPHLHWTYPAPVLAPINRSPA